MARTLNVLNDELIPVFEDLDRLMAKKRDEIEDLEGQTVDLKSELQEEADRCFETEEALAEARDAMEAADE